MARCEIQTRREPPFRLHRLHRVSLRVSGPAQLAPGAGSPGLEALFQRKWHSWVALPFHNPECPGRQGSDA